MAHNAGWRLAFQLSALLALIAGLLLFVGATRTDDYFSWTIAPAQTAAFLGATYWAAAILFAWASAQRLWETMRIAAITELVVAVLLLVATQLHLDKFHDNLFGYFWVAVYAVATPVLIYLFATAWSRRLDDEPPAQAAMPAWLRGALILQSAAFAVYAVGLYVAPSSFESAWPWPLTPLTARAVAAFLAGFAIAAAIALQNNDLRRFRGAALTYAALGILQIFGALLHTADFRGNLSLLAFIAFFATVLGVGACGSVLERGSQLSSSRSAFSGS